MVHKILRIKSNYFSALLTTQNYESHWPCDQITTSIHSELQQVTKYVSDNIIYIYIYIYIKKLKYLDTIAKLTPLSFFPTCS